MCHEAIIRSMKTIIFATGNQTKILHARESVKGLGIEIVGKKLDLIEPREDNPKKVVLEKAVQALAQVKGPIMVEDSGIFIRALGGFPKTFVHFAEETIGIANILKMMEGVKDRYVEFRQSLAYYEPGMTEPIVFSYVDGNFSLANMVWETENLNIPGFNKILIPPGESKPLCTFGTDWQAKRDSEANKETIHYGQLANWLSQK